MRIAQAAICVGGDHDGVRLEPPGATSYPESLFCITWDDGARYARTDEHIAEAQGTRRVVFRHDPDGSLTALAQAAFSGVPPGGPAAAPYRPGSHRYSSASQT